MTTGPLRLLVAGLVGLLLLRAGRVAWHERHLVLAVWRAVRLRTVAVAAALLGVVAGVATLLSAAVPVTARGLGDLVGFSGNAVFVPLEEAVAATPVPVSGPDWPLIAITTAFLGVLALLLPWLAFVEEEVFRAGLETASPAREVVTALGFGLVHMVMLVPLAAALAIAIAGFVYGRTYRRATARAAAGETAVVPAPILRAYRPGRRARAAVATGQTTGVAGQAAGVFASTVLHTAFNTLVIALVWLSIVTAAFTG